MDDKMLTPFERRLSARLRPYAEPAVGPVDAAAVAHAVARARPRTRVLWDRLQPRLILRVAMVAALLAGVVVAGLVVGAIHRPDILGRNGLIAFATNGGIAVANSDGSNGRTLTSGLGETSFPTWSPDGAKIAFWSKPSNLAPVSLTVLDAQTGSSAIVATLNVQSAPVTISWAPDSQGLAFSAFSEQGDPEVLVVRVDGTYLHSVAPRLLASDPAWSPDGRQIAFRALDPADLELVRLYVAQVDGTDIRVLAALNRSPSSDEGAIGVQLDWSPDGKKIAFGSKGLTPAGGFVIAVADVASGAIHDLTAGNGDGHPLWSPDGEWIAFDRGTPRSGDEYNVALVRPDGSDLRVLTGTVIRQNTQSWSPDGTHIVAYDLVHTQAEVIPIDGTAPSTFAVPGANTTPSWQRLPWWGRM